MKRPVPNFKKEQDQNIVVLKDLVDSIISMPLTKYQEEKIKRILDKLYYTRRLL